MASRVLSHHDYINFHSSELLGSHQAMPSLLSCKYVRKHSALTPSLFPSYISRWFQLDREHYEGMAGNTKCIIIGIYQILKIDMSQAGFEPGVAESLSLKIVKQLL